MGHARFGRVQRSGGAPSGSRMEEGSFGGDSGTDQWGRTTEFAFN